MNNFLRLTTLLLITITALPLSAGALITRQTFKTPTDSINSYLSRRASVAAPVVIDTFYIRHGNVEIHFKKSVTDYPIRPEDIKAIERFIYTALPEKYSQYGISLYYGKYPLQKLVSDYYSGYQADRNQPEDRQDSWIAETSLPVGITEGLAGRNIALWGGHGYYYSEADGRWEWQRAPFFSTIEDLLTHSYITGFLAPMLENAGANVLIPRERDIQAIEIIVDDSDAFYTERNNSGNKHYDWKASPKPGFSYSASTPLRDGDNPFSTGTARMSSSGKKAAQTASYLPYFPATGDYAVYVSYQSLPQSVSAKYTVKYAGGERTFIVNQSIGGGTWVYLGTFRFTKGETGQGVTVSCAEDSKNGVITTDAVRFGGGMGNVSRGEQTSGYPRYAEAARYWLQWSGFPESVYSLNEGKDDYKDDYMCRGEWVNSLKNDFNVPLDIALALHTDAGVCLKDSIIGTLAIYKEESEGKIKYSDGRPRITARELADIVQTSIVDDIRAAYRQDWTRRAIWDRSYMEARVPDIPAVLIELLSHQNFADMQCALDPKFKFIASRAIYKGILRYLSYTSGTPYTVQPLPVKDFSAEITGWNAKGATVRLQWTPRTDTGEPTAVPTSYIVYRRTVDPDNSTDDIPGFDNGRAVSSTVFNDRIEPGMIYSYKIVAVNQGGLSFPSEILSAGYIPGEENILVVNGFTDVSAPASYPVCDSAFAGFDFRSSHGTPYIKDISYIGEQYEYTRNLNWIHNDRPGFGASYMDYGPKPLAGNTMDYPLIHGLSIMRNGRGFCSTSIGALISGQTDCSRYPAMDIIMGKNTGCFANDTLTELLTGYLHKGGAILISGSHIGQSTDHDSGKTYPESIELTSAADDINSAISKLAALRDSISRRLSHPTAETDSIILSIDRTIVSLTGLYGTVTGQTAKSLSEEMRSRDAGFKAHTFASEVLKYLWSNGNASSTGEVRSTANSGGIFSDTTALLTFQARPDSQIYCTESPDAIIPAEDGAFTFLRYMTVNTSAAVAYDGDYRCVSIGFPIETLTSQQQADDLMREVMEFLLKE